MHKKNKIFYSKTINLVMYFIRFHLSSTLNVMLLIVYILFNFIIQILTQDLFFLNVARFKLKIRWLIVTEMLTQVSTE